MAFLSMYSLYHFSCACVLEQRDTVRLGEFHFGTVNSGLLLQS